MGSGHPLYPKAEIAYYGCSDDFLALPKPNMVRLLMSRSIGTSFPTPHTPDRVKGLSKLVGCRLSPLVKKLAIVDPVFSLPSMLGVRDIFAAASTQKFNGGYYI